MMKYKIASFFKITYFKGKIKLFLQISYQRELITKQYLNEVQVNCIDIPSGLTDSLCTLSLLYYWL